MRKMTTVVLGGGISGLSCAYYLTKSLPKHSVTLVEASNRLGGWIKSNIINDKLIFEQGPRTLRPAGPTGNNTLSLIEELGISDQILPITFSHPAAKNRMIYVNKQLHSLPSSLSGIFLRQTPFTKPLIRYLMHDLFAAKKRVEDEPIYDFVSRRFGNEFADYLISPLICGICAGDAKEISVKFLMRQLFEYEQEYGSISKGLARSIFKKKDVQPLHGLALRAKRERWSIYSFKNGLETLPSALDNCIKDQVNILLDRRCERLEFCQDEAILHFKNAESLRSSHVISSISSENLGKILQDQHPDLANLLQDIKTVTVGVVNLCYKRNFIKKPGFGFLVPPKEKLPILGVIYDSCSFPRGDDTVLTVMMGGRWFEQLFGDNPTKNCLLTVAKEQVGSILGIREEPIHFKVNILRNCIPQYVVGHYERVDKIREYIRTNKLQLSLCGASYDGVGVNDVIVSAKKAVDDSLRVSC